MTKKKWLVSMLGVAAMFVSAGALAQQSMATVPNFYVGLDVGQTDADTEDDTGFKIFGGYQFHQNIGAEVGYGLLFDKDSVEVTSLEAVAVGMFPLGNNFSLIGKLGFAMLTLEAPGVDEDETELTWAIGAQYDFTRNLGARLQWQRYEADEKLDFLSIGVVWRF
jgi:OmpA-OmpF porin, OOP family